MKILDYKITFVFLFFILTAIILFFFNIYKNHELSNFLDLQTKEAKNRYEGITFFPKDTSDFIFHHLINTQKVRGIFKNAHEADKAQKVIIRQRLHNHLVRTYEDLKSYNIQQLHFHLPNNESFLRFHRPEKYGDNLTEVRKTVEFVNKNKIAINGFEEGRIFNGFRFVYPLFDSNKKHIGSVEISHSVASFKKTYERSFKNIFLEVIIDKSVVDHKVFKSEKNNYAPSEINPDFMHLNSIKLSKNVQHAIESIVIENNPKKKMDRFEDFAIPIDHETHKGLVTFTAIKNAVTFEKVAYAVSFQRSNYLAYFYENRLTQGKHLIFLALLLTLVLFLLTQYHKELKNKVYKDSMLNIYNRRFFEVYLLESFKKKMRNNTELSLVMFDVDHFKKINDTYGHDIGDHALRALVKVVEDNTRKSDVFARWGGEEFMLLLENNLVQSQRVAENLRLAIIKYTRDNSKIPSFTCSFGVINLEDDIELSDAYTKVDGKLYEAKETGRNKVVV